MALEYFGQDFEYTLYPLTSDGADYELLPALPIAIYLFESAPNEADAASGTGAIQTIAAWTDTDDANGKKFTVIAIDEPTNLSPNFSKKYYLSINTLLKVGNTLPPLIKEITLQRLMAQESMIRVTISDLLGIEPTVAIYCECVGDLQAYIDAATKETKMLISGCDFSFSDLWNPSELNFAVAQLAISKFFFGQSQDVRDIRYANGIRFKEEFSKALTRIKLEFDSDHDGKIDGVLKVPSGLKSLKVRR